MAETVEKAPTKTTDGKNGTTDGKKELPLDIFSDAMPEHEELPLDGQVKEQPYAAIPDAPTTESTTPPPPPPIPNADGSTTAPPPPPPPTGAPVVPAKTPEEIRTEAEQLVDMLLRGYEKLHGLGRWAGKVDETELVQSHFAGKINLNQELPIGKKTITVKGFFEEYNAGIDENIQVDQEFKDKIKPPMIRIAIKRGWCLGDELYVGMLLGEDLATKTSMLIGLKKSANLVLKACHELMKKQNKENEPPQEKEEKKKPPEQEPEVEFTETTNDEWREEPPVKEEEPKNG